MTILETLILIGCDLVYTILLNILLCFIVMKLTIKQDNSMRFRA